MANLKMLKVRAEQMQAFEQSALLAFEAEMVAHGKTFAPVLSKVIGDEQLHLAVRYMIAKAGTLGFTLRGPIRLCVELMFLCGSEFDTDPQYPMIGEVLRSTVPEMQKAERIHRGQLEYLDKVAGPHNINVWNAENAIVAYARSTTEISDQALEAELLGEMMRAFPQRAAYIGEPALRAVIAAGRSEASKHGLSSTRGQALMVILMSAFGHGCTNDRLYPWISQTLTDPLIADSAARAQRLERKSLTWLEHVLASPPAGAPA